MKYDDDYLDPDIKFELKNIVEERKDIAEEKLEYLTMIYFEEEINGEPFEFTDRNYDGFVRQGANEHSMLDECALHTVEDTFLPENEPLSSAAKPYTSKKVQYKRAVRTPHCWKCKTALDSGTDDECPSCGWIICPSCGACEFNCHTGFERMGGKEPVREFTATPKPSDDIFNEPNRDICGKYRSGDCFALGGCATCSDFVQVPLLTLKYK